MAIRWINNYHRGFNRLWLVLSCLVAFAFVGFKWLSGLSGYSVRKPEWGWIVYPVGTNLEKISPIRTRMREQWREWYVNNQLSSELPSVAELLTKSRILKDVESMKEAKYFSKNALEEIIDQVIKREKAYQEQVKTYPQRVWKARGRFVRDLLGTFIVTFAFGHGVFVVVYWITKVCTILGANRQKRGYPFRNHHNFERRYYAPHFLPNEYFNRLSSPYSTVKVSIYFAPSFWG